MMNERITEDIVREHFKNDMLMNKNEIEIREQKDYRFNNLFKHASKKKSGNKGFPEFIISFKNYPNLLMIIECKGDKNYHESKFQNNPSSYAVDGILHYMKSVILQDKNINLIGIAVSGNNKTNLSISNFIYKNESFFEMAGRELLSLNDYLHAIEFDMISNKLQNLKIIEKAIEYNIWFENYSIPTKERSTFVSSILLALQYATFRRTYKEYSNVKHLVDFIITSCENILKQSGMDETRREMILQEYQTIRRHKITTSEFVVQKNTENTENNRLILSFINELNENIYPLTTIEANGYDILGRFYSEFIKYAGSDVKTGLVLTPSHITELFCELLNLQTHDVVYDPCCGTGGFLVSAMQYMIRKAHNNNETIKNIKRNQLIGTEIRSDMFAYACSNMLMRGDGKSNVFHDDCFNRSHMAQIKEFNPTVVMLNPPYSAGPSDQLKFVINAMDSLKIGGRCACIVQMSCALVTEKDVVSMHKELLNKHTLEAVISMPNNLFYPSGNVVTCIMVFTAHIKHPDNYLTWLGYFKEDGYITHKKRGRIESENSNVFKENLLENYKKYEIPNFCVKQIVSYNDEWCAEAYMQTDYKDLKKEDFDTTVFKYVTFLFSSKQIKSVSDTQFINSTKVKVIKSRKWKYFKYNEVFLTFIRGKRLTESGREKGNTLYFSASDSLNGWTDSISNPLFIEKNAIIYTTFGDAYYIEGEFTASDEITILKHPSLNKYNALFITTIMQKNKYKYSFGRKAFQNKFIGDTIALPITKQGNPDWQYMEDYIKSLPYSSSI